MLLGLSENPNLPKQMSFVAVVVCKLFYQSKGRAAAERSSEKKGNETDELPKLAAAPKNYAQETGRDGENMFVSFLIQTKKLVYVAEWVFPVGSDVT